MNNPRKPVVVVTRKLPASVEARMGELFSVELNHDDRPFSREKLADAMARADVLVPTLTDTIDAALIDKAGSNLKLIASFSNGIDNVDVDAAARRGITVTNTPNVLTEDTADMTMALVLAVPRRLAEGARLLAGNEPDSWQGWSPTWMLGRRIWGKRLGIVGMGRIGQAVAHRAHAFGLEIAYHNRKRLPEAVERMFKARWVEQLDDLMSEADILSLHCPAGPDTHHMIDARRIGLMKDGACLINTARGDLVDQEALIAALESGKLAGAGLDVYPDEPDVDARLIAHPNVMTLPHIGSATREGREDSGLKVIANIRMWADGHRPPDQVLTGF